MSRAQSEVRRRSERTTRRLLHLWNLPAGSDVTRLLNEIGALQQQVRDLTRELNDANATKGGSNGAEQRRQRPARPRPT
jgi:hypothetical protein